MQQVAGVEYTKPDTKKLQGMIADLRASPEQSEQAKLAYSYLTEERGFTDETIDYFKLGYCKSKNAVAIPHFKDGELINIKYRFLEPDKIRYTSEPNAEQWVYHDVGFDEALSKAKKGKTGIAIAEGEMDAMSLWQMGFKNVISPGSGANSYGTWIEEIDKIKQVWIAYDNDDPGQGAAKELAERIGVEKCRNVTYPGKVKDANEFMIEFKGEGLRELFAKATPFFKYEFSGLSEVIQKIIDDPMEYLEIALLPGVKLERDNLMVLSGETNAGKSTYSLNIIKELAERDIPSLFLPIERGVYSLGRRFLQILLGKTQEDMTFTTKEQWRDTLKKISGLPVYMAKPKVHELEKTIVRAKRLFGIRVAIIDHMDYLIRGSANKEALISEKMHELKHIAEQNGVVVIVITHINRGALVGGQRPTIKNLKGSSSLEQDSEIAVMLYPTDDRAGLEVDVQKNKGPMMKQTYAINVETGVINGVYDPDDF